MGADQMICQLCNGSGKITIFPYVCTKTATHYEPDCCDGECPASMDQEIDCPDCKKVVALEMNQNGVDYTALHKSHEVVLRVELLAKRLALLSSNRDAAILEIGLGSGDTTKMLVDRYDDVTCVDLEQTRIDEVARYLLPKTAHFIREIGRAHV